MKSMFVIYLAEDDDGFISVPSEQFGDGEASYTLGMNILIQLKKTEMHNPRHMHVSGIEVISQLQ